MTTFGWLCVSRRASAPAGRRCPHGAPLLAVLAVLAVLAGCASSSAPKGSATKTATATTSPSPEPLQPALSNVTVPAGFATLFASGLDMPRFMAFGPDGSLFIANRDAGSIVALRDPGHTGRATQSISVASGLDGPISVVYANGALYVSDDTTGNFYRTAYTG